MDLIKVDAVNGLRMRDFSAINKQRCERWHGIHEWSLSDWATAAAGELGEACNLIKKLNRIRDSVGGNFGDDNDAQILRNKLALELADVATYVDLLATAAGVNLEECVIAKFNAVSVKNGFPERIESGPS